MEVENSALGQGYIIRKSSFNAGLFARKQPLLRQLDIELTERCNNACIHCYINLSEHDRNAARRELTTHQWKAILKQAADLGALSVRFTGGEPLLRDDFMEIYLHARKLGMQVTIFTNARLITSDLINLFTKVPPLKPLEVSIYGMHAESYDAVARVKGAFTEFRKGVDLLLEGCIPFVVKSVLLPPNRDEMQEYETWVATIPGSNEPAYLYSFDLRTRRDSARKNDLIRRLRFSPEAIVEHISRHEITYRRGYAQFAEKFFYPQGDELFDCGAGDSGCVDAYGKYQMCMLLRHPDTVYDLTRGTLQEALVEVFPRMRAIKATNPDYLKRCACCFLKGLCEQCPAKSWSEHGTLDTPVEYLCQVAHAQARFLGLLTEGEYSWEVLDWKSRIDHFISANLSKDDDFPAKDQGKNSRGCR